jgi:hypothetical protein
MGQQGDAQLAAAALWVMARATTNAREKKAIKGGRLAIVHHGDLVVKGDLDARWVLVTGSLDIKGRLSNYEGCLIAVGGDLRASGGLLTEGPLWVDGDTDIEPGIVARHNDYRAHFRGRVTTPVLVKDDHIVEAGKTIAGKTFSKMSRVPPPVRANLAPLGIQWAK